MSKNIKYIFVDMDGVLADFLKGCEEYIGHPITNDDKGHTQYDLRKEELTNKIAKALEEEANGDFELAKNAAVEGINDVEKLLINHTKAV